MESFDEQPELAIYPDNKLSKPVNSDLAHAINFLSGAQVALMDGDQATALRDMERAGRRIGNATEALRKEMSELGQPT